MILLLAGIGVPFTTLADEPAPVPQTLVIEFKFLNGIHQEIVVTEGTKFEVITRGHGDHVKASGRIGRVHDEQVDLVLSLHGGEPPYLSSAKGRPMHYKNLPIGRFYRPRNEHLTPYRYSIWVRRGVDPVPALLANFRRLDRNSLYAAWYIKKLHGDAGRLIPELVRLALGDDDVVRKASALKDVEFQQLRMMCTTTLGDVGQGSPKAAEALQTILAGDDDERLRIAAAVSLWKIAKHHDALTSLVGMLRSPHGYVRHDALAALAVIGPEAPSIGPSILPLLYDPYKPTRAAAAWALWRTTRDPRAVERLIVDLKSGNSSAVEKLGMIGYPAARRAAPLLAGMVFRDHPEYVAAALRRVDPDARQSLPLIALAVSKNEGRGAEAASKVLASYGPKLLPALHNLLEEGDDYERSLAFYTLWRIGPAAVDTLADALLHTDPENRRLAAVWLKDLQIEAAPAVPVLAAVPLLVEALNDDFEVVRAAAAEAIKEVGPPAVPAVQQELKQENKRTRQRAEQILERIKERGN